MSDFKTKLEKIIARKQSLNEDQRDSPTRVHPEKGIEVNNGVEGTSAPNATSTIKTGVNAATLKTTPSETATAGPTGHIPVNSDLPRPQLDGFGADNKNAGSVKYELGEEADDKEDDKLPAFLKKKEVSEEDDKEDVDEETEANDRAGYTDASKGKESEKFNEEKDEDEDKESKEKVEEETEESKEDKKAVNEALKSLMKGQKLSEAFKEKTATIFEATLSTRLKEQRKKLTEKMTRKLNERVEDIRTELSQKLDGHLDLVVEHWAKQNQVGIESVLKSELNEEFMIGFKNLFLEHYIEVPENKVDIVVEMTKRVSSLEEKLNEQINDNIELKNKVRLNERNSIFSKATKGLASTQVEKLRSLTEGVSFRDSVQFENAVKTLKESVIGNSGKDFTTSQPLNEQLLNESPAIIEAVTNKQVASIQQTLNRMAKSRG